jgi:hypothetical protein
VIWLYGIAPYIDLTNVTGASICLKITLLYCPELVGVAVRPVGGVWVPECQRRMSMLVANIAALNS